MRIGRSSGYPTCPSCAGGSAEHDVQEIGNDRAVAPQDDVRTDLIRVGHHGVTFPLPQFRPDVARIKQHRERCHDHRPHLVGADAQPRGIRDLAHERADDETRHPNVLVVETAEHLHVGGGTPISSDVSRSAAASGASSPSTRPPGNEIWPLWCSTVSVRWVSKSAGPWGRR